MQIDYESIGKRYKENGGFAEAPEIATADNIRMMDSIYQLIDKSNSLKQEDGEFIKSSAARNGLQISNVLLLWFLEPYSKILGKNLVPTYSFTRTYYKGSDLPLHSDRPACQYSITLNIGASEKGAWPFWLQHRRQKDAKKIEIHNEMYVPIFYMGEELWHWREKLKKLNSTHIFMHYVDRDDPNYKPYWYDGRKSIRSVP